MHKQKYVSKQNSVNPLAPCNRRRGFLPKVPGIMEPSASAMGTPLLQCDTLSLYLCMLYVCMVWYVCGYICVGICV